MARLGSKGPLGLDTSCWTPSHLWHSTTHSTDLRGGLLGRAGVVPSVFSLQNGIF